jgi:hypothetical protein
VLFDGEWSMSDLRLRYENGCREWERDGYRPLRVPD